MHMRCNSFRLSGNNILNRFHLSRSKYSLTNSFVPKSSDSAVHIPTLSDNYPSSAGQYSYLLNRRFQKVYRPNDWPVKTPACRNNMSNPDEKMHNPGLDPP